MKWTSLDIIVRRLLLDKGYPIHYYLQNLSYAAWVLQELHFDTLKVVNTKKLTLSSNKNVPIPCDYLDYTKVGIPNGQSIRPFAQKEGINRLPALDSAGNETTFGGNPDSETSGLFWGSFGPFWNMNVWNESTGRIFGGASDDSDTFKVIKERNIIQFSEKLIATDVILEYISDGSSNDAATQVDPQVQGAIKSYCNWQLRLHNRTYSLGERNEGKFLYLEDLRKARARMDSLTLDDIRDVINRRKTASYKG